MFERKKPSGKLLSLPIDQIHPSPFQARKSFDEQELTALAQSIRENGLLQPVTVRRTEDGYELVAGERRLRACQLAKMTTIPAILCSYADDRTAALGLLENIQRADLNPFEQAQGLRDVMVLWDCTQAEAAKRLGMAQPTFANKLRLLQLTADQRQFVLDNNLTERHARALLRLEEPELQRMAARGMQFSMTLGPFTLFLPAEPTSLRIHLEPARTKIAEDDPEIIGLYESAGWTHLGDFRKNFYVFATPEPDAQAHTDPQVLSYALRRFFRQKLLGGAGLALLNFLILSFFYSSRFTDPTYLRFYWAELLAGDLLPWLLALLGMGLTDLSYLLGLFSLWKFRRQIRHDLPITTPPASRLAGVLSALAVLPLVLVAAEFTFLYFTHGYFPYDLAGSGFVTMAEIEGPEFRPTGDTMYNMDYISHGDSPLTPESWYYQQWESNRVFGSGGSLADIPHLEINITRYLLPAVAERRAWEWRSWGGHEDYQALEPAHGLEEIWYYQNERNPGFCYLILRKGGLVMRVEYEGSKDLTQFLPRFAQMLDTL